MFQNKFIAVKTKCSDFRNNSVIHEIETISMEEFKNKTINENIAIGSNIFNAWGELELYDSDCSCYIADYEPTPENISFFKQKPLSKKDLTILNQIPIGGVFTFTYISELHLPNDIKDINQYSISHLEKSYQIKNIKIYKDQKVNSIILSLIYDFREKHYKEIISNIKRWGWY